MSQAITLSELKNNAPAGGAAPVCAGFDTVEGFVALQRMGQLFNTSTIVPAQFQGKENLGNAVIAIDMALRMHANPLMVMQNIYVVHGRPAWSAQFLIATLNKSGRFTALKYEFQGKEGADEWGCRAVATELATGEKLEGPLITIALAKREGWAGKNGSKWQTMPELMLRYRAASWFVRTYAPEIAMGLPEADELRETIDVSPAMQDEVAEIPAEQPNTITVAEVEKKASRKKAKPLPETVNDEMGEVIDAAPQQQDKADELTPEDIAEIQRREAYEASEREFYGD